MDASTTSAIENYASSVGFDDPATLMAVAFVESAGVYFWTVNGKQVPAIRFEGHYFDRILKAEHPDLLAKARQQGLANPTSGAVKNPNSWAGRYDLFQKACAINEDAAIRSTSWGIGQVMGDNAKAIGYQSAAELKATCSSGLSGQIDVMWKFIVHNRLDRFLEKHNWADFAKGYNGAGYRRNRYDQRLAEAYAQFRKNPEDGHIRIVQTKLVTLGFYTGKVDGIDGPKTDDAIRKFQDAAGLVVDGEPGSVTIEALDNFISEKKSKKSRNLIPAVAGGASVLSGGVAPMLDAMDTTQNVADHTRSLLESIDVSSIVITIVVAIVVIIVLGALLRRVRSDGGMDTIKQYLP